MKPKIGNKAKTLARQESTFWTTAELRELLNRWRIQLTNARKDANLRLINMARFNILKFAMALELKINRQRWYS